MPQNAHKTTVGETIAIFTKNRADSRKVFAFHSPRGILRYGGPPSCARVDGRMRPSLRRTWNCTELTRPKIIYFRPGFPAVLLIRPQAETVYDATHSLKHRGDSRNHYRPFAGEH